MSMWDFKCAISNKNDFNRYHREKLHLKYSKQEQKYEMENVIKGL